MFKSKTFVIATLVIMALSSFCLISGQEEADKSAPVETNVTLGKIFKDGGLVGWGIVILSVIGTALFIGNLFEMRRDKLVPPDVVEEIEAILQAAEEREGKDGGQA